jgi:hypothetical protein
MGTVTTFQWLPFESDRHFFLSADIARRCNATGLFRRNRGY